MSEFERLCKEQDLLWLYEDIAELNRTMPTQPHHLKIWQELVQSTIQAIKTIKKELADV